MDIPELIYQYGGDILEHPLFQSEKSFVQHSGVSCFEHSVLVACTALWLADKLFPLADRRSIVRGALLHDYFLYDWHVADPSHRWHGFSHAATALLNAQRDFDLNLTEMDIISTHMFPLNLRRPRCRESIAVNIADKLCAASEVFRIFKLRKSELLRRVEAQGT